jgi:hypothetical protein
MSLETAVKLKRDWTDRYVVVVEDRPELLRFVGKTGQVKTVNMNGRCLVEFDGENNIGWYDIDPSCLTLVEKPDPNAVPEKKPAAPKAAAKAESPAAKAAPAKPAAASGAGRPSVADILAAARGKADAGGAAATAQASAPVTEKPAAKAAAPKPAASTTGGAAPTDTAGKIAWCRQHDARG